MSWFKMLLEDMTSVTPIMGYRSQLISSEVHTKLTITLLVVNLGICLHTYIRIRAAAVQTRESPLLWGVGYDTEYDPVMCRQGIIWLKKQRMRQWIGHNLRMDITAQAKQCNPLPQDERGANHPWKTRRRTIEYQSRQLEQNLLELLR